MPPGGQQAVVVYGIGPDGRSLIPLTLDASGVLQVSSGGGGGGGAATIANGADIAEGATTDTPAVATEDATARTIVSLLKGIKNTLYVSIMGILGATNGAAVITDADGTIQQYLRGLVKLDILTGTNAKQVQGPIAHDAAVAGNPIRVGSRATISEIVAVADADVVDDVADKYGRKIISLYAPVDRWTSGHPAVIAVATAVDILAAAGVGLKWYLRSLSVINAHATVDTLVTIQDDSAVVLWRVWARHDGGGEAIKIEPPIPTTANGKLQVICGTTGASVYVDASAFKGP